MKKFCLLVYARLDIGFINICRPHCHLSSLTLKAIFGASEPFGSQQVCSVSCPQCSSRARLHGGCLFGVVTGSDLCSWGKKSASAIHAVFAKSTLRSIFITSVSPAWHEPRAQIPKPAMNFGVHFLKCAPLLKPGLTYRLPMTHYRSWIPKHNSISHCSFRCTVSGSWLRTKVPHIYKKICPRKKSM